MKSRAADDTFFGMSLMFRRNSSGPITFPCGPPEVVGDDLDAWPSTSTVGSC